MTFTFSSCQKTNVEPPKPPDQDINPSIENSSNRTIPNFNLEVILRGDGKAFGHVKFRQDNDPAKIVTLDTWVRDLEPNHSYKLQRAVDTNLDGNCTSTAWLTLGKGTIPQMITTDAKGTGSEELWRSLAAFPSGTMFDIHFRVIDAANSAVVLTSSCYQFTIR
jgi:hypothetical protein